MRFRWCLLAAGLLAALPCAGQEPASADRILLKNGDRLSGKILEADGKAVKIRLSYAGDVAVQWAAVEQIESAEPLYVTTAGETVVLGRLSPSPVPETWGVIEVVTADDQRLAFPVEAIHAVRSPARQADYEENLRRRMHPRFSDYWAGSADASFSLSRGNTDALTFLVGGVASRTSPRQRASFYMQSRFSQTRTAGQTVRLANATRGGARMDFALRERVFTFGFADFEADEFQRLDLRSVWGGGLGFHVVRTPRTFLEVFAGGSLNRETFSTGLERSSGEGLLSQELSVRLNSRTTLLQRMAFFPNLTQGGEYRLLFDSTASLRMNTRMSWQASVSNRYLTNPNPGTRRNDLLVTTGIRLSFGQEGNWAFASGRAGELLRRR